MARGAPTAGTDGTAKPKVGHSLVPGGGAPGEALWPLRSPSWVCVTPLKVVPHSRAIGACGNGWEATEPSFCTAVLPLLAGASEPTVHANWLPFQTVSFYV